MATTRTKSFLESLLEKAGGIVLLIVGFVGLNVFGSKLLTIWNDEKNNVLNDKEQKNLERKKIRFGFAFVMFILIFATGFVGFLLGWF